MLTDKYLFTIDLDGTLLKNSKDNTISDRDKKNVLKLIEEGHIVCIVTGRPWHGAKKIYEELELDTIIGNYNGAQIHNPCDYDFNHWISYLDLNDVMYILGDEKLQEAQANIAIEGPGWAMLDKKDDNLESIFGLKQLSKLTYGLNVNKIPLKPTGVIIDMKKGVNHVKLIDYLDRKYGDLVEISSWSKGDGLTPVLDFTNLGVSKGKVVALLSRYYDIKYKRTIAIGDGYNDLPMFAAAEISVAMKNSTFNIRRKATYVTERTNQDSGVSDFIEKFLNDEDGSFIRSLKDKRKDIYPLIDETVK